MHSKSELTIPTERLSSLVFWNDFFADYPNFWESPSVARNFLNTRRAQMTKAGALFKTTKGLYVDPKILSEMLPGLLQNPDQEQLALPLDNPDVEDSK